MGNGSNSKLWLIVILVAVIFSIGSCLRNILVVGDSVSNEIMQSFKTLESSIDDSNRRAQVSIDDIKLQIMYSLRGNPDSSKVMSKIQEIELENGNVAKTINELKSQIIAGATVDGKMSQRDKKAVNMVMIDGGKASDLKNDLIAHRKFLLAGISSMSSKGKGNCIASFNSEFMEEFDLSLADIENFHRDDGRSWEELNFKDMPTAPALTLLNKMENDLLHSLNECYEVIYNCFTTRAEDEYYVTGYIKSRKPFEGFDPDTIIVERRDGKRMTNAERDSVLKAYKENNLTPNATFVGENWFNKIQSEH